MIRWFRYCRHSDFYNRLVEGWQWAADLGNRNGAILLQNAEDLDVHIVKHGIFSTGGVGMVC